VLGESERTGNRTGKEVNPNRRFIMILEETYTLNNGISIPKIAFGT
jgi:hypothetical protein